jgi:RNA polymerase sigma factor (sigma-70 family)
MPSDAELLLSYARERSESAFAELVRSHIDLVYSAAARRVGGNPHAAKEVTQTVFMAMARHAEKLSRHPALVAWLHASTRNAAANLRRREHRRELQKQQVHAMQELQTAGNFAPEWQAVRGVVDEALDELSESDRQAILLRFFENHSYPEIGSQLGLREEAVRMRVGRALEKLRGRLERRGVSSTAAILGGALSTHAVVGAPAGLATAVTASASAATMGVAVGLVQFMSITKVSAALGGAAFVVGVAMVSYHLGKLNAPIPRDAVAVVATSPQYPATGRETASDTGAGATKSPIAAAPDMSGARAKITADSREFTPLDELKVLADLQQRKLIKPGLTFFDRQGKLDWSFVDLFALTPAEQGQLQQAIDGVREKLANLERENAKITREADGNITVAVQPFPVEGGKVYDEMIQAFAEVLGPERNEAYHKIGAEQFEKSLGRFGAAERTYVFGYDTSERPGQPYTFQDKVVQRLAKGGFSSMTDNTRFQSFDEFAARVGPIVSILPPDYKRGEIAR